MIYNLQLVTSRPTSVKGQTAVNSEFVFLISNVNLGVKDRNPSQGIYMHLHTGKYHKQI